MSDAVKPFFRYAADPAVHVSVLVPVYKVEKYIGECARSLFGQTMREGIEFIFVDDCTPDRSIEVLEEVLKDFPWRRSQVRIEHNERNCGSAETRNRATVLARGEYIIHCDSDDWVEPDMYDSMYRMAGETDADVVICGYFNEFASRSVCVVDEIPVDGVGATQTLLDGRTHNAMWNKLIRRSLYNKLPFWFTPGVNMYEDVSILPRLLRNARVVETVRMPFYHYNLTNPGAYTRVWNEGVIKQIIRAAEIIDAAFAGDTAISLDRFKARLKLGVSKHGGRYFRKNLRKRFPEGDKYILRESFGAYTRKDRIRCWCEVYGLYPLTMLIDLVDKVRGK